MREWLIAIGVLVVFGILLDGLRRMRNANRDSIQITRSMQKGLDKDELDELPGGGARVVKSREERERDYHKKKSMQVEKSLLPTRKPIIDKSVSTTKNEPGIGNNDTLDDENSDSGNRKEPSISADPDLMTGAASVLSTPRVIPREENSAPTSAQTGETKNESQNIRAETSRNKQNDGRKSIDSPAPEKVIVMHVLASGREGFAGTALLEALLASGMRYGEKNIFHHYVDHNESGVMYSLANAVKPGTFDLESMDAFHTPGVTLFMVLPNEGDSLKSFDSMLMTIHTLLKTLGGELRDENRNIMTQQTIAHARQQVVDFERRQLSKVASSDQ